MGMAGIRTPSSGGGPCNVDRLPLLIAVGHEALPLLALPLTVCPIPHARMTDELLPGGGLPTTTASNDKDVEGSLNTADEHRSSGGGSPRHEQQGGVPASGLSGNDAEAERGGRPVVCGPAEEAGAANPAMGAPAAGTKGPAPPPTAPFTALTASSVPDCSSAGLEGQMGVAPPPRLEKGGRKAEGRHT